MPNSYSLRISSNSSTFALQSNEFLRSGSTPDQEYPFVGRVGQNKLPKWASSEYRNQHRTLSNSGHLRTSAETTYECNAATLAVAHHCLTHHQVPCQSVEALDNHNVASLAS